MKSVSRVRFLTAIVLIIMVGSTTLVVIDSSNWHGYVYALKSEPKVLFDFTKDEDAGNADWTINGAYSSWADNLTSLGYIVDQLTTNPITYGDANNPQDLSNYAVYIIPEPQDDFNVSESEAIREFVLNGGGLILISDHNGADRNNNGRDAVHIFNEDLSTAQYGITFNYDDVSKDPITDINTQGCPPITENVSSIGIWNGATIKTSGNATGLIFYDSSHPVVVNSTYGKGRVVAIGDSSPFDDGTADSSNSGDNLHDGWDDYSDAQLGINMVRWAAGNNTGGGNSSQQITGHKGESPYVAYGNGEYLMTFVNGNYVNATLINSDGTQSQEFNVYKYGAKPKVAYNPDGNNFTVVSYDYSLPRYHKIIMRFVEHDGTLGGFYTVSNDANQSVDVAYGNEKLLIVWANLTRREVKGAIYNTSTAMIGNEFIISSGAEKYNVAVGYDSSTNKFLVVWTTNYDIHGVFVNADGTVGNSVSFPSTPYVEESMLSVAGGDGKFMITYRNGSFSKATGLYFYLVNENGNVVAHTINNNSAKYCGVADVKWIGNKFVVTFSDVRSGTQDVYVRFYDSSGVQVGDELVVKSSADAEETPSADAGNSTMLIAWYDYTDKTVDGMYYPPGIVPELNPIFLILALLVLIVGIRRQIRL